MNSEAAIKLLTIIFKYKQVSVPCVLPRGDENPTGETNSASNDEN